MRITETDWAVIVDYPRIYYTGRKDVPVDTRICTALCFHQLSMKNWSRVGFPFNKKPDANHLTLYNGKEVINQQVLDDANAQYDGWFYRTKPDNKVVFKFSQAQQNYLYNIFTESLKDNKARMRYRLYNNDIHATDEKQSPFKSFFIGMS